MVEESLRIALGSEPDIEVVGSQSDPDHVEERVLLSHATMLLIDGSIDGERLVEIISRVSAVVGVIVLASQDDPQLTVRCMTAGAIGYLPEVRRLDEITTALRRAQEGWVVLTREQVLALLFRSRFPAHDRGTAELSASLSGRERAVLRALADGATLQEAAIQLGISTYTVQTHIKNAMRKLNVRTRIEAILMAMRSGILGDLTT